MLRILLYHASSLFFLIINLYFLIYAVISKIFNSTAELLNTVGTPSIEAKAEIETHSVSLLNIVPQVPMSPSAQVP